MNVPIRAAVLAATFLLAACASSSPPSTASSAPSPAIPLASEALASDGASDLVGSWHRAQTCQEMLAAFDRAGLAASHVEWLTGNFFGGSPAPTGGDVCEGARGPLEHSHFFTAAGGFGSHDENGQQVDDGDYRILARGKVAFPSHATEFGYAGDLVVDYGIKDSVLTFDVALPQPCDASCKDTYAWALSAFASGTWARGEVP